MTEVTKLNVQPRKVEGKIDKHTYTITFNPTTKAWEWKAKVAVDYILTGSRTSLELARAEVTKKINKFVEQHHATTL